MRKIFLLFLCVFVTHAHAQTAAGATFSVSDQDEIIRQCLKFEPLEAKTPKEVLSKISEYHILNHGIDFKGSSDLKVNAKHVSFLTKSEISLTNSYFLFHTISIVNTVAFVKYYFVYTDKGVKNTISITIDFEKSNELWRVVKYTI